MSKNTVHRVALAAALLAMGAAGADQAVARGGFGGGARGGGIRSGGFSSMSRPSGGNFSRGGSGSFSRGGGTHVSTLPSGGGRRGGGASAGQLPSGGGRPGGGDRPGGGQRPGGGERPGGGGERPQRPDRGDINVGNGNDIHIDGGWGDYVDHPIAAGIAVGAAAGLAAAAVGSWYYDVPTGCSPYPYGGYSYYSCGSYYLQPSYEGDTVIYVTVPDPRTTEQAGTGEPPASPPAAESPPAPEPGAGAPPDLR